MKTITVRDLRQRWPEIEKALQTENEILIIRDGEPVAKLVRIVPTSESRLCFDAEHHGRWQARVNRGKIVRWVQKYLLKDREDLS